LGERFKIVLPQSSKNVFLQSYKVCFFIESMKIERKLSS
jgi:hypothetical protein